MTDLPPDDYQATLTAAINSWLYYLTYLLPAAVNLIPVILRLRYTLWLVPFAFLVSGLGYFIYWQSIDVVLTNYYHKTGYYNTADTWFVFMPIVRGIPNVLLATAITTFLGWMFSGEGER